MSRIEEALRRAAQAPSLPEELALPEGNALDYFDGRAGDAPVEGDTSSTAIYENELDDVSDAAPVAVAERATGPARSVMLSLDPSLAGKLVVSDDARSTTIEQYRRLAGILHQAQCVNDIKVVMVASAVAGEGKTLTAVNLALTLSESYARRVLLIDADFRRPTLHNVFRVSNISGLNDSLKADADRKLTIFEISPRLSLLPAGRPDPDPMSGLTSGRMRRIVDEAAAKFEWVILDTPPIGLITDAHLLAAMVNVAVLVVQAGRTPCSLVQRAVENLGRDRIIGVVLNWVDERAASPGGKYGEYYSAYHTPPNGSAGTRL